MFGLVVSRRVERVRWFCRRHICGMNEAALFVAAIISLALLAHLPVAHAAEEDDGALMAERQIRSSDIFTPGALEDELYNPTIPKPDLQPGQTLLDNEAIEQASLMPALPAVAELQQTLLDHPSLMSAGQQVCEANQADARELAFKAKVRHAEVRAPVAGIVSAVHIKTVGAVVQAGTVMAEIVPDEQALLVEVRIKPEDIA